MIYTENNIYTDNFQQTADLVVDDNSRLVTMKLNLDASDIINLKLTDKIWIDGQTYILNKIEGFDPRSKKLTTVELIKLPNDITYTPDAFIGRLITDTGIFLTTDDNNFLIT